MNRKGAYSGIIASIAIVAIIAIAFNSSAAVRGGAEQSYSKAIVDAKRDWQNARYLLDKSASDALADDSSETGVACSIVYDEMANYFTTVLSNSIKNCEVTFNPAANVQVAGSDVIVTVAIKCTNGNVDYAKSAKFEKRVGTFYDVANTRCLVDVLDKQSTVCEVDKIGSGQPNDLCSLS